MNKSKEIQAPNDLTFAKMDKCIFLAGSIEMGKAENWQKRIVDELSDKGYTFFNPRRDDWDSS